MCTHARILPRRPKHTRARAPRCARILVFLGLPAFAMRSFSRIALEPLPLRTALGRAVGHALPAGVEA